MSKGFNRLRTIAALASSVPKEKSPTILIAGLQENAWYDTKSSFLPGRFETRSLREQVEKLRKVPTPKELLTGVARIVRDVDGVIVPEDRSAAPMDPAFVQKDTRLLPRSMDEGAFFDSCIQTMVMYHALKEGIPTLCLGNMDHLVNLLKGKVEEGQSFQVENHLRDMDPLASREGCPFITQTIPVMPLRWHVKETLPAESDAIKILAMTQEGRLGIFSFNPKDGGFAVGTNAELPDDLQEAYISAFKEAVYRGKKVPLDDKHFDPKILEIMQSQSLKAGTQLNVARGVSIFHTQELIR